jgi:hypothetical protein
LRDLYAERFGAAELEKQKKAAEGAAAAKPPAESDEDAKPADQVAQKKLPMLQRLGKIVQGEPQVTDASAFYGKLQERLEQRQPLPEGALPALGAKRATAILTALKEAGVNAAAIQTGAPENTDAAIGKPVALKLGLAAK